MAGPKTRRRRAVEMQITRARPQLPENGIERGRLAAAVRADDAENFACDDVERHPIHRDDAAEAFPQIVHRQHRAHRAPSPCAAASGPTTDVSAADLAPGLAAGLVRRAARPSRPEGQTTISTTTRSA